MEEHKYGGGVSRISFNSTDEVLGFLQGLQSQPVARDLVNEGAQLFTAGKFAEAEAKFKAAIAANPRNAVAHANIGNIYFQRRNYSEAIVWLEKALALDGSVAGVEGCLRQCREKVKGTSEAKFTAAKRWWQFWK